MDYENIGNSRVLLFILAAGVFGILNTEMGFIGILPYIAEAYQVTVVQAGWLWQGLPCPCCCPGSIASI